MSERPIEDDWLTLRGVHAVDDGLATVASMFVVGEDHANDGADPRDLRLDDLGADVEAHLRKEFKTYAGRPMTVEFLARLHSYSMQVALATLLRRAGVEIRVPKAPPHPNPDGEDLD